MRPRCSAPLAVTQGPSHRLLACTATSQCGLESQCAVQSNCIGKSVRLGGSDLEAPCFLPPPPMFTLRHPSFCVNSSNQVAILALSGSRGNMTVSTRIQGLGVLSPLLPTPLPPCPPHSLSGLQAARQGCAVRDVRPLVGRAPPQHPRVAAQENHAARGNLREPRGRGGERLAVWKGGEGEVSACVSGRRVKGR